MPLDDRTRERLERALRSVDEHGTLGPRLLDDARRLWRRVERFLGMGLVVEVLDADALELACYALQLPQRRVRLAPTGRLARTTLRDRAEEAAEQLVELAGGEADDGLLDRTARLLHEMPHRTPMLDESRLLADAVNLEDFGALGVVNHAIQLGRQGDGPRQLADGCEKRDQYGYWEARLKDSFHFDAVRAIARDRLAHIREICRLLQAELHEDEPFA